MRRRLFGILGVALVVAACGGTDKDGVPIADAISGFGEPAGAVSCDAGGHDAAYHIHVQLSVKLPDGTTAAVPPSIGVGERCMYWLHTHESDGKIHIEAPNETVVALADFLEVWRRSTNPTIPNAVATKLAEIRVMGELVGDPATVLLTDGLGIEITVTSFPAN